MTVLPDEYLIQLGRITAAGAALEEHLHQTFAMLASERPPTPAGYRWANVVVDVLLADDSLSQQIDRLRLLAARTSRVNGQPMVGAINRVVTDDMAASLNGLVKRCDKARETRNVFVHAVWSVDPDGDVRRKTTRRLRREYQVTTVDQLERAANEVEAAVEAASNFHYDLLSGKIHTDWGTTPGLDD